MSGAATRGEGLDVVAVIGTKGAFARLTDALAAWALAHPEAHVWLQHGEGALPIAPNLEGAPLIRREVLLGKLDAASAVVCHAGSGTLRDALALGHRPVVVPRLARHGEHVNDHQLELVEALGDRIIAVLEPTPAKLDAAIAEAVTTRGAPGTDRGEALKAALRADLDTLTRTQPRRRDLLATMIRLGTWWVPRKPHRWDP